MREIRMNIKSIQIKNFRNFKDFSIEFSKGFQTIIGENNIGKSNLYWAIRLIFDKELSYNSRRLEIKDFHGFKKKLEINDNIIISIELYSENLAAYPTFHAIKTGENTARITYLYAHKSKFVEESEKFDEIEIDQFKWQLFGGGKSLRVEEILQLSQIKISDLDGINLYYINAFRNVNSELYGNTKSLLSKYCQSRQNSETELESIKAILSSSSSSLNSLEFMPNIAESIHKEGQDIAGKYFSFPVSISFSSNYDTDAWNQLNLYYNPQSDNNVPIQVLGLGQKNVLYLSLFIAELENSSNNQDTNILLIEEPEAHLHPQLQKILFSNLSNLKSTQIFMTSHSTHIASDCNYKNLNILYKDTKNEIKSFSPFKDGFLTLRENMLLKRYLDATRSEMFFSSAIIFVEGVAEQFIIPAIAREIFEINITEHNISIIPIHSRYFDPFLKVVQNSNFEIPVAVIIDGDFDEIRDEAEYTKAVENARLLEVDKRVSVFNGRNTLEIDLFPQIDINSAYLKKCFIRLGHKVSLRKLIAINSSNAKNWGKELIKRIEGVTGKGRFAQELSLLIDSKFVVPDYISDAIRFIAKAKNIRTKC
jgi:putative ATP-dependent endonuclease of OLD family